ncbi:MAG: PIN domain-containing protein [Tepidiformaceae bacterium]
MSADFIDSNVFIYLFARSEPGKQSAARAVIRNGLKTGAAISYQVVQETLNVITRKLPVPVTTEDARHFLDAVLVPLWRVMPTAALYQRALDIKARYQFSFYDSLIIAAALAEGCTRIYSEDLQHGQRIEGVTIINPFLD